MAEGLFPTDPILIVDDEKTMLKIMDMTLRAAGMNHTLRVSNSKDVMPLLAEKKIGVILLDISMPGISGEKLLELIKESFYEIPVIMITGLNNVDLAVRCMKNNAFDYMVKPIDENRLLSSVKRAIEFRRLYDENQFFKQQLAHPVTDIPEAFRTIITRNKTMKNLFVYADSIAKSHMPLLITGETGVGKELMARGVHIASGVPGDFVSVNVAGIDDNTFSDTLFGHLKGAFTGANSRREGLISKARGGTLFLDEIGDLKPESQIKLLRVLQENEYFMLGADVAQKMDARVIVATNHDLEPHGEFNQPFRKDLYYRLSTHHVHIPPLRKRPDDLPLLIDFFLKRAADIYDKPKPDFSPELVTLLTNYAFPGNIRELEGMISDAVSTLKTKTVSMEPFKKKIKKTPQGDGGVISMHATEADTVFTNLYRLPSLNEAELLLIQEAMQRTGNNKSMAAEILGISRQKLARQLKAAQV